MPARSDARFPRTPPLGAIMRRDLREAHFDPNRPFATVCFEAGQLQRRHLRRDYSGRFNLRSKA
jgi:hypothetical protein